MSQAVTGLVLTYNGERLLDRCLESLAFCDHILVVDSESSDRTREIAATHGAEVLVRKWEGPVPQFCFAFEQIRTPWIISLDQDEYLTPELSESIQAVLKQPADQVLLSGFQCARRSFYFDRFLRHSGWYPDRLYRFFKRDGIVCHASGPHYSLRPTGPTGILQGDIVHYPYAGLSEHMDKLNYYTQEAARDLYDRGVRCGLAMALLHGMGRFVKLYLVKGGFLDGRAGLILALHGFFYAFHKYVRVAELAAQNHDG